MPSSEFCMGYVSCLMLDSEACNVNILSVYIPGHDSNWCLQGVKIKI
jgi:hypothetical protein